MNCKKFDKLINLFLDGRLDQNRGRELKEHLSRCQRCREKLAFLQSVEAKTKEIEAKEPPEEYWDTFSSRVRDKILAQRDESPAFSLKSLIEGIFSFSPLKIKLVAGVISVVLVFVIGKLYVDYRGEQIIPSKKVVEVKESPKLDIAEKESGEESPAPLKKEEQKTDLKKPEIAKGAVADRHQEVVPSKKGEEEKSIAERGQEAPSLPPVTEEKSTPVTAAPAVQIPMPDEGESDKQVMVPESKAAGAGGDKEAEKKRAKIVSMEDLGSLVQKDSLQATKVEETFASQADHVGDHSPKAAFYVVDGNPLPQVKEPDTVVQADTLRKVIQAWKAYVEKHPDDSLSQEGYSQIATAYYLLARASQDTSLISEGSNLIRQYMNQAQDPAVKDDLNRKLKQIRALRQK